MSSAYVDQLKKRKTLFMTKNGLDNLKKRLDTLMRDRLETVKRMHLINTEEKGEPLALMDEVRRLEASEVEAAKISNLLQYVQPVVKPTLPRQVQVGSEVTLQSNSKKVSYTIVCPLEIDMEANKISEESPLGNVLLGKSLQETVVVSTRKGEKHTYKIIDIK